MKIKLLTQLFGFCIIFSIYLGFIYGNVICKNVPIQATEEVRIDNRILLIDSYYKERNMPLYGYGKKLVEVADKYNIDPFLLPAISIRESSGGKHMCKNNPFGWGSCRIKFDSIDEAIEIVGKNLGGENPKTAYYYKNTPTYKKLYYYNGTVVRTYPDEVIKIMSSIQNEKN